MSFDEWNDQLWVPDLVFYNTEDNVHTMYLEQELQSILQAELTSPNKSFTAELDKILFDFTYEGKDVIIFKNNDYAQWLQCEFNWKDYPFDTQVKILFILYQPKIPQKNQLKDIISSKYTTFRNPAFQYSK